MSNDFIPHLEELRRRILIALAAFVACSVLAYFFSHDLIDFLTAPLRKHQNVQLIFQTPYEGFLTHLKVSAVAGFLFSAPVVFAQFWLFVSPGLYEKEKRLALPLTAASIILFLLGAAFAYYIITPWGLYFLMSFQTESLRPLLGVAPYFSFLLSMIIAFGIVFDLPVIVLGLVSLGIVDSRQLAGMRRIIIVGIFIFSAVLTPSPDPVSQVLLALPLFLLFETSLFLAAFIEKKKGA